MPDYNNDFMKKLRLMSMIKGRLIEIGRDPDIVPQLLMDDYDSRDPNGISQKMASIDPDNAEEFDELMVLVLEKMG